MPFTEAGLRRLVWGLEELSADDKLQYLMWSGGIQGQMHVPEEAACSVFDDSGLARFLDSAKFSALLPTDFQDAATNLRQSLIGFPFGFSPEDHAFDERMQQVREDAKNLLIEVKKLSNKWK